MQDAIEKADVLLEALGWIRQFRGKVTVIKLGGSVMVDEDALRHVLLDIVFMESVGMRPVVVHGGGAAISRAMDEAGVKPNFIQGRRYTDEKTLEIVENVLACETNQRLTDAVNLYGGQAQSLNFKTQNVLFGEKIQMKDSTGNPVDLGHVGAVTRIDTDEIIRVCDNETVPVIPSMCIDEQTGGKLNVNADTAATAVAQALSAEKLVFLSDVNGVRREKDDPDSLLHSLTIDAAQGLIADGSIESGMIPKVQACIETLQKGVGKIHIIDGRLRHSLLLEIYTNTGVGTQIVQERLTP